jgi:gas vesicle protein
MEFDIRAKGSALHNSVGLWTGLLVGGMAGFGAMMLFAPQSGKRTRSQIRQKGTELHLRATETFDDLVALPRYDNRIILAGSREKANNPWF